MAFNGSGAVSGCGAGGGGGGGGGGGSGASGGDGPLNKRLCTGKENNEAGINNNRGTQQSDELRRKRHEASRPNHILLFTIINPVYPITVEVLHTISSPHGQVQRIVIFKKNGVQAMVEQFLVNTFDTLDAATRARENLNGADIYSGCCTLKIDFAKPEKLNVYKNDSDTSWDYTLTAKEVASNGRSPLLQDPLYGSRPQPYTFTVEKDFQYKQMRFQPEPPLLGPGAGGFPTYGPPEFHQSGGDVGAGANAAPGGWKPPSVHATGLMKDPPIAAGGRNGPSNFVAQGQQQGAVMMVYGLDNDTSNTDKLFNLVCLYGNVARIKFLKTKEGTAMVQMGDGVAVERCVQHLNNIPIGSMGKLQIAFSKQNFLSEVTNPFSLPDHTPSFKEYTGSKNNRFLSPAQASKNRIQPPSKILHFFNTPPSLTEEQLINIFNAKEVPPTAVRMFPLKTERSSSGLVEFPNVAEAVIAIMKCNHIPVENKGTKFPFIMKLCFSSSKSMNNAWNMENIEKMNEDN